MASVVDKEGASARTDRENPSAKQLESQSEISFPTKKEVLAAIPKECFERSLLKASLFTIASVVLTVLPAVAVYVLELPISWAWAPVWFAYALWVGTAATGCWVIAHECGHRAFCRQNWIQDAVGFTLHSALLVPYFSWQRSHALHHAKTNHLDLGETFVPIRDTSEKGKRWERIQHRVGDEAFALFNMVARFLIGWPAYLLTGATGGPARGTTNHFWPIKPFSSALFPGKWPAKVWASTAGVLLMLGLLGWWAYAEGSVGTVLLIYGAPYLVVNFWLVLYTWLQHTAMDVPHFEDEDWTWVKGAFMTIDRPYGPVLDFLHHRIGSTHVAHHIDARIPHYNAKRATEAIAESFPHLYRFDPTPVPLALWKVATHCNLVTEADRGWVYKGRTSKESQTQEA